MLNKLVQERDAKLLELEELKNKVEAEKRALTKEEVVEVEKLDNEIKVLDESVKLLERDFSKRAEDISDELEVNDFEREIRNIGNKSFDEPINLTQFRKAMTMGDSSSGNVALGKIAKKTYADEIMENLPTKSPLFNAVKKIYFSSSQHSIPIMKEGLTDFAGLQELAEYTKDNFDIASVSLVPIKIGKLVMITKELIEDSGYNIVETILNEFSNSLAKSFEKFIVKGLTVGNASAEGLESFNSSSDSSKEVTLKQDISVDDILAMYYALPVEYRSNATWVMSDAMAQKLSSLKTSDGYPIFTPSYLYNSPIGTSSLLLGRPVIINNNIDAELTTQDKKPIFFGDLNRALLIGIRRELEISRSNEVAFLTDSVAIKGIARFDIKKGDTRSMVVGKVGAARSKNSAREGDN